jgi:transposase
MEREERRAAKARFIANLRQGQPWQEAAAGAGLHTSERSAYRLRQRVRVEGEAAVLLDARHGHPHKLREPMRSWLVAYCRGAPGCTGQRVQAALAERFQFTVSVSQINRVRAVCGVGYHAGDVGEKRRGEAST